MKKYDLRYLHRNAISNVEYVSACVHAYEHSICCVYLEGMFTESSNGPLSLSHCIYTPAR